MGQEFLLIPIEVDFPCYFQQSSNYFFLNTTLGGLSCTLNFFEAVQS